jgi:hypothetical protein
VFTARYGLGLLTQLPPAPLRTNTHQCTALLLPQCNPQQTMYCRAAYPVGNARCVSPGCWLCLCEQLTACYIWVGAVSNLPCAWLHDNLPPKPLYYRVLQSVGLLWEPRCVVGFDPNKNVCTPLTLHKRASKERFNPYATELTLSVTN